MGHSLTILKQDTHISEIKPGSLVAIYGQEGMALCHSQVILLQGVVACVNIHVNLALFPIPSMQNVAKINCFGHVVIPNLLQAFKMLMS